MMAQIGKHEKGLGQVGFLEGQQVYAGSTCPDTQKENLDKCSEQIVEADGILKGLSVYAVFK